MKRSIRDTVFFGLMLLALTGNAFAQADRWPSKPIRIVVTFSPGGSSDIVARVISVPLAKSLGQPVVVDNKPGAGGTIGASEVARAAPDGYTLLMSNTTPISLSPFMLTPMPYDPMKSFQHVSLVAVVPDVIMVHPSVPAKNMAELTAWIKAQQKPVNYGSGGIGSIGHILGETFKRDAKLAIEHVGYKGSSPMISDLLTGTLSFSFDTLPQNVPHIKAGKLRPIAVTSRTRSAIAPDIPTVIEANMPSLVAENFIGVSAPAGLPDAITKRLHAAIQEALDDPTVTSRLAELGMTPRKMSTTDFTSFVSEQMRGWEPAVKASGAKLN
ncbi:MAG TPA: tripartite tricarboxylate transporter substrate binding protein [Casimicrobiaceae bacterium]|nr:tripartite tricarboxylate transporter substrate binding protein [Casimicrobiaceae bacterium]